MRHVPSGALWFEMQKPALTVVSVAQLVKHGASNIKDLYCVHTSLLHIKGKAVCKIKYISVRLNIKYF